MKFTEMNINATTVDITCVICFPDHADARGLCVRHVEEANQVAHLQEISAEEAVHRLHQAALEEKRTSMTETVFTGDTPAQPEVEPEAVEAVEEADTTTGARQAKQRLYQHLHAQGFKLAAGYDTGGGTTFDVWVNGANQVIIHESDTSYAVYSLVTQETEEATFTAIDTIARS
jgi:hypothetical protein